VLNQHVGRILRTMFAYGFFDRPSFKDDDAQIDKPAHAASAQKIEEKAITLLTNRGGALPLKGRKLKSIAVIGADANQFKTGGGSGDVTPFDFKTPLQAITDRAGPGVHTTFDDGSDAARAAAAAKNASVAIVFAGDYQSEGSDKQCLTLECPNFHGDQDGLINQVAAAQPNTILVLESGGPVLTPWRSKVKALLEAWYPGQQGGPAIARVLFGDAEPGGRLPVTFPKQEADLPTAGDPEKYPGVAETVKYKEGVLVGYRWYDAKGIQPAFPFGYGKGYTTFTFRKLKVTKAGRASARISVTIRNVGRRTGTAVPQLYLGLPQPAPGVVQPPKQLRGMRRVTLKRRKSRRITFKIGPRDLSYWNTGSSSWKVAPGCYAVMVGSSSRRITNQATLAIGGARCGRKPRRP
jgi:beta-glucosidase